MAITERIIVTKATVDYTDDFEVVLKQEHKKTRYTAQQAEELAEDLLRFAIHVRQMEEEFVAEVQQRISTVQLLSDIDNGIESIEEGI